MQGRGEQRTKAYMKYDEGAAQALTQQGAKSDGGATGFAGRQASRGAVIAQLRRASMGFLRAAFRAGATLNITPTATETLTAKIITGALITGCKLV